MSIIEFFDLFGGAWFATGCLALGLYIFLRPRREEMDLSNDNVLRSPSNPNGRPRQVLVRPPAPAAIRRPTIEMMVATGAVSKSCKPSDRQTQPYVAKWKGDFSR